MKMLVPAIAAALVFSSCYREGPNLPLRPIPPMPGVASREAETQAFYKGSKLGNRDRRNSLPSNVMGHSSHYDESTREAFSLGYHNGYKRLPRPAR